MAKSKTKTIIKNNIPENDDEIQKSLETVFSQMEKKYGTGTLMKLGDTNSLNIDYISTGSIGTDIALGLGGIPRGRIIELYGPEASGKTTLCLHIIAETQKSGGIACFIDAEHSLDAEYASKLGVDIKNLFIAQPDTGEDALDIAELLIRSGAIDILVVDSVAALVPKAEIDGNMGDSHVGLQARMMGKALRKLTGIAKKNNTTIIFINQIREKVGIIYGSPEVTSGGRALKFMASVRMDIRRIDSIKKETKVVGNRVRVKIIKNKVAPPFKQCEFDIMYGEGISKIGEIIDIGTKFEIINKSGSWFSYNDIKIGQGREAVKKFLVDNDDILTEIEKKIRVKCNLDTH